MKIDLIKYGPIISDKSIGDTILREIRRSLKDNAQVIVDFDGLSSMATFNAKQIFGQLYRDLGPESFFEKIELKNVTNDLKIIIRMGIESALENEDE